MSEMSMHATMRAEPIADDFDPQTDALGAQVVDHGELDAGTRRVLLQLIRGPYLREATHQKLWPALVRDEEVVRSRLADLYLDLVVDHGSGIAFVRNLAVDDAPSVVRSHPLTLLDTALVLFLRRQLLAGQGMSVRTFVGRDEIEDQLQSYRRVENTDKKGFNDRVNASINKMRKNSILLGPGDNRWEVSPVLALIFGADEVTAVTRELRALSGDDPNGGEQP